MAQIPPRVSGGGIAGQHPTIQSQPTFVAPTTAQHFNTLRPTLIPFACWRLDDIRFDFDSSFVLPEAAEELPELKRLIDQHSRPGAPTPLSVFGHADPTGSDDYNKPLSGRRAQAIYGLLTRDTELWEKLYSQPLGGDDWSKRSLQSMLGTAGHSPGASSGAQSPQVNEAVRAFQTEQGLAVDGVAGPLTRAALFGVYMDALCRDDQGVPYRVEKSGFLGRGEDPGGKADLQGCSEFNPILLFSQQEEQRFAQASAKAERNLENASNRRVVVFLFHSGAVVDPARWPCPRVAEGGADCKLRFWSDGEERRSRHLPEERRLFEKSQDTLACRFYHRMAANSPCEQVRFLALVRVYDLDGRFIPNAPFRATADGNKPVTGRADANGVVGIPVTQATKRCTLEWDFEPGSVDDRQTEEEGGGSPEQEGEFLAFRGELFLQIDEAEPGEREEAEQKLANLGFPTELPFEERVAGFQEEYGHLATPALAVTGELDEPTLATLREVHEECADELKQK